MAYFFKDFKITLVILSRLHGCHSFFQSFFKAEGWDLIYARKKEIYESHLAESTINLMPGVSLLLKELELTGKKRCVVTNSTKSQSEAIKKAQPILKTIPLWITREDYKMPKPFPDGYVKGFEMLADPKDRVIGFEDSLRGIEALKHIQALPVLICNPNHPQRKLGKLKDIPYFTSFRKIPEDFSIKTGF